MDDIVFDQFYDDYDNWYATAAGAFFDRVETSAAFSLLAPKAGMRILDAGCGTGNFSLKLAEMGCQVTGIDIARNMLAQAQAKAAKAGLSVSFSLMDAANMGFAADSFDAVLSMAAIEFVPQLQAVYDEMKRVLKPGGTMVIGTIQKRGAWEKLYSSDACADMAYARACFKTQGDLRALDPGAVVDARECLFVPPGLADSGYTDSAEAAGQAQNEVGGFVCVKYQKRG